jgi:capsid assembly protease
MSLNIQALPPIAVAAGYHGKLIEALQFVPSEPIRGGWDGAKTRGSNVKSYERTTEAGRIGIIEIAGPLWTSDDPIPYFYGFTTYESIGLELGRMVAGGFAGIVLAVNSPGGMVAGVDDLAGAINEADRALPLGVSVHVMGSASSAAYWLSAAAGRIVADPTAQVGSIGAVLGVYKGGPDDRIEFVSAGAPLKRAEPDSLEGAAEYQKTVDAIGGVFVQAVADFRGVSAASVLADFGRGGELVGVAALKAGMIDTIGSLEYTIKTAGKTAGRGAKMPKKEETGAIENPAAETTVPAVEAVAAAAVAPIDAPALAPAAEASPDPVAAALAADRDRCAQILEAVAGTALEAQGGEFIASGATIAEVNTALVKSLKESSARASRVEAGEKLRTLSAMAEESARVAGIDGEPVEAAQNKSTENFKQAWAAGARSAIAAGGGVKRG